MANDKPPPPKRHRRIEPGELDAAAMQRLLRSRRTIMPGTTGVTEPMAAAPVPPEEGEAPEKPGFKKTVVGRHLARDDLLPPPGGKKPPDK